MDCPQFEERIFNLDALPPGERETVQAHLAACEGCAALARELQGLDDFLASGLRAPRLSAAFEQRLRRRIHAISDPLSESLRAERKRQMQAEYDSLVARWGWLPASRNARMELLAWAVLAAWAVWMACRFVPRGVEIMGGLRSGASVQSILLWSLLGALFLGIGLAPALVFRRFRWP
jgi:anti-sigma factor RsiW